MPRALDRPRRARCVRLVPALLAIAALLRSLPAHAQPSPPAEHRDDAFDLMNLLTYAGKHDLDDEAWNAYGQFTYISSWKLAFARAPSYDINGSGNSLTPDAERSFTGTFTLFLGARLWPGGEVWLVPEVVAEQPLSGLHGLGGAIQNFELQKTGSPSPTLYRSRTYLRQTLGLGGERQVMTSQPSQLATVVDARRIVITAGNASILDVFDKNSVAWDPRRTFFNMAFMTHASWDFPSDARGYSWGGTVEFFWDDWSWRVGRITPPQTPNGLPIDFRLGTYYGDELELEHDHTIFGQAGAVRLLGYHNRVYTGSFSEAIAAFRADPQDNAANCGSRSTYGSTNATAPDLCWVRRPNDKVGLGVSVEQHFTEDLGIFGRAMYSDGRSEVDAFNAADRSVSLGVTAKGGAWHRPFDVAGAGVAVSWISSIHAQYLAMGGVDAFIGDGYLHQAAEGVTEAFYSVNLFRALWLSGDYQFLWNPGYNAARGPVNILGGKVHGEF